ncbi:MAG TPA: glycosyltransferase family 4 protein, partial [Candidatus Dormibacteraeota bacterium]|nr:glycosyltransferase family 4 protein [Candidatus Dormibacteraeota bacterium]
GSIQVTVATNSPRDGMDDSKLPYAVVRRPTFGQLKRLIRDADIVHLAGPCLLPMLVSWATGKPFVVVHHVYQAACPNGLLFKQPSQTVCPGHFMKRQYLECVRCCSQPIGRAAGVRLLLLEFARRWLCKRAAANVMITNHVGRRLHLPRSQTIYYGIDEVEPKPARNVSSSEPMEFGYVGRLVAEKGLPLLIEAAKHLADGGKPFRLTFIGDGPERAQLEALVQKLGMGNCVSFTGDLRGAALEHAASRISVLIMPSIWEESAGLAAIEQMMRGRMVIAADIGGLGEIVGDAGLKFTLGDSQGLAALMLRVIDEPSLVGSLGSLARTRATEMFCLDGMIEPHVALYRELLQRRSAPVAEATNAK